MRLLMSELIQLSNKVLTNSYRKIYQNSLLILKKETSGIDRSFPLFSGFIVGFGFANFSCVKCNDQDCQNNVDGENSDTWTLYQYATCPFCNKVRTFLDFYGIDYNVVEVNPLFRNEIKFSEYRKVPILKNGRHQLNDSSLIISVLKSNLLERGDIETLLTYYPVLESTEKRKKVVEYQNRYNVMYQAGLQPEQHQLVKEEAKWRRWVDDTFVHTLSPNIYRTMNESLKAMDYFTHVGNFSSFQRSLVYYSGAVAMYVIGKRLKKRYHLKDDVRESMYAEARIWMKGIGKKRQFMGGDRPNLADLNMYGVIHAIEGLEAFDDLLKNTSIGVWYKRMKRQVETHAGRNNNDWLLDVKLK